jgi:hypothetical protein
MFSIGFHQPGDAGSAIGSARWLPRGHAAFDRNLFAAQPDTFPGRVVVNEICIPFDSPDGAPQERRGHENMLPRTLFRCAAQIFCSQLFFKVDKNDGNRNSISKIIFVL